ncbi:hypothetical protein Tco_0313161 [Tanacetum coccineum]
MANLSEDIQCAGSDTRPPMLDRTDFASWQQRIRLYCRGKENGVNILKSIDEGRFQMGTFWETLAEGTKGALHLGPERPRVYSDLSPKDKERYNADIWAINILLQGLPKDIYSLINHYTDAKDIWDNVKMLLESSELTKEDCESQLYDDFEHFCQHKGETIHGYYVRFAKLIKDMRNIKMTMSRMQLNSVFVNNMFLEWGRFVTAVKLNRGLRDSNYDQLYAYLKQHEAHAKENKMMLERFTQPNVDPLALMSNVSHQQHNSQSSTNPPSTYVLPHFVDNTQLDLGLSPSDNLIKNLTNTFALLTQSYKTVDRIEDRGTMHGVQVQLVMGELRTELAMLIQVNQGRLSATTATENGVALDEDQLLFITGGQDNAIDEDVDEQPVQELALNVDNVFQADDCDAFDSDVDEAPTVQTRFMANLSSVYPVYDEAGLSYDLDILSEVHDHDHYQDVVCEHHEEPEMHDDVQPTYVVDSHANYMSDSNMISYDQYVKDNAVLVVQSNVSSVPNDAYMMIFNDMHEPHAQSVSHTTRNTVVDNSLTAKLVTYKEQVELYKRRARFEITEREQKIDEQLRIVITDRNIKEENLKKELHSVKMKLVSTINHNKSMNKVAIGYKNPLCLTRAKQVQPALYNAYEIIKNNHVPALVYNTKDTLEIAEITRRKMNDKMKDPECVTHKVKIAPPDYSKENYLATFTPQKQLTPDQILWSQDLIKMKEEALKKQTTASRPIKALMVYPLNTPATLVPRVLPTKSSELGSELGSELTFLAGTLSNLFLASELSTLFQRVTLQTDFASWQQRIRLYCRGKENGVNILKSIDEGPFQMGTFWETLAEGTEGALHLGPERPRVYSDLSPEDKERMQLNSKFVNNMLPEWGRFVTAVKLNRGLRDSNYDQLYAYLKQHETHANENKMILERFTQPNVDPHALMSNVSHQHTFALLTQSYKTYLPQTNNQLGTSYNPRNQATVQDGWVVVQNVQGRQNRGQGNNARGASAAGYGGDQNRVGNANPGQSRQVNCYNCNARENGVALDEDQLLFIIGRQDNAIDEDVDEQPVQDLALNVDNVFQAYDCDPFDSDVVEAPTAQTMFMANLSSAYPIYDEAGPSYDLDILSEVHDHAHYQDAVYEHHEEHEMHDDYVKDNAVPIVQSNVSYVPNDAYMMIFNDMHDTHAQSVSDTTRNIVVDNSLTAELATYKEKVEMYERRARFKLTEREQKIDEQLRIVITKENKYLEEFLDMKALKEKVEELNKVAIGYKNPLCLTRAKQVQPALYNGYEIVKNNHVLAIVHNTEDTLEIAEITRRKMHDKMKDPECVTHKVKITPPDYSKEIFLATFTPQKQLTPEQIFWSQDIIKMKAEALKEQTTASRPTKALIVYPPNTPTMLVDMCLNTHTIFYIKRT